MIWEDRPECQKGYLGEDLVFSYLENLGYRVYPCKSDGNHLIDFFAVKTNPVIEILMADAKAKARMTVYDSTGINIRHYDSYKESQDKYGVPVYLYFIDETPIIESIYGQYLTNLHPYFISGKAMFSLWQMEHITKIPSEYAKQLRILSNRNHEYWEPKTDSDFKILQLLTGKDYLGPINDNLPF